MPHVKTHRAPWIVELILSRGVTAFKTATPREAEMVLDAGASEVIWSYPTLSAAAIKRVIGLVGKFPGSKVVGLVDSFEGLQIWVNLLAGREYKNLALAVDLDPGMGRTGIKPGPEAIELAQSVDRALNFAGWHVYDGHIQDADIAVRERRCLEVRNELLALLAKGSELGLRTALVAGGSYSFAIWAKHTDARVSTGSWTFSSSQHQHDLADRHWKVGAYVLSTVISGRNGTVTVDAGSKAISPDMPMDRRFAGAEKIVGMKEEHTIVMDPKMQPGDRVALVPRHACTTAYLYPRALVGTAAGKWEYRDQLGCER
ncbi:hypothetical protein UB46_38360 [Burkholderiaceae bacterium 16]|nr:hypothetical protein UB46_38360 [Burkholderiaceae bacterium 16]